jgi:Na+-translocating ferredoxin:NAD+ oxidoreductase RnfG subunit
MDKTTIFLLLTVWYFGRYPQEIYHLLFKGYQIFMYIANFYIDYYTEDEILKNELQEINNNIENNNNNIEKERYEDKYLSEIRKMDKEFKFDEEEQKLRDVKFESFISHFFSVYEDKIKNYKNELNKIKTKYNKYNVTDEEFNNIIEEEKYGSDYHEEYYDTYIKDNCSESKEQILQNLTLQEEETIKEISKIQEYIDSNDGKEKIITQSKEESQNFIINNRLDKLSSCYVMETTPQGNVLMIYDNKRKSFKYYSDNSIPYRYLEPVARKYVKLFNCRPVFVDMEEELRLSEEKWEKERREKEENEKIKKINDENNIHIKSEEKKNVFAKFKSYNKDGASGKVNMVAPPKNSIPMTKEQENEKIILKEKANRYTYEGKMVNFSFLKKVDRKVVDKKYGLSFADFKRMKL